MFTAIPAALRCLLHAYSYMHNKPVQCVHDASPLPTAIRAYKWEEISDCLSWYKKTHHWGDLQTSLPEEQLRWVASLDRRCVLHPHLHQPILLSLTASVILRSLCSLTMQNMPACETKKKKIRHIQWYDWLGQWSQVMVMSHASQDLLCCQKRATTFISRPPAPPEPAPEPWAWFDPWPTSMWWRPELKLAHSRLVESLGDRETSGPAPSRDNVAKQTEKKMAEREPWEEKTRHPTNVCVCAHSELEVTCCVLIPDFDRAVVGGCRYPCIATRMHGEKHAAGCGLKVASVFHYFTAWLAKVPQLITDTTPLRTQGHDRGFQTIHTGQHILECIWDLRVLLETSCSYTRGNIV